MTRDAGVSESGARHTAHISILRNDGGAPQIYGPRQPIAPSVCQHAHYRISLWHTAHCRLTSSRAATARRSASSLPVWAQRRHPRLALDGTGILMGVDSTGIASTGPEGRVALCIGCRPLASTAAKHSLRDCPGLFHLCSQLLYSALSVDTCRCCVSPYRPCPCQSPPRANKGCRCC